MDEKTGAWEVDGRARTRLGVTIPFGAPGSRTRKKIGANRALWLSRQP